MNHLDLIREHREYLHTILYDLEHLTQVDPELVGFTDKEFLMMVRTKHLIEQALESVDTLVSYDRALNSITDALIAHIKYGKGGDKDE